MFLHFATIFFSTIQGLVLLKFENLGLEGGSIFNRKNKYYLATNYFQNRQLSALINDLSPCLDMQNIILRPFKAGLPKIQIGHTVPYKYILHTSFQIASQQFAVLKENVFQITFLSISRQATNKQLGCHFTGIWSQNPGFKNTNQNGCPQMSTIMMRAMQHGMHDAAQRP